MSWGVYWMFYRCPSCGKKFKSGTDTITEPSFGRCPACGAPTDGDQAGENPAFDRARFEQLRRGVAT